MCVCVEADFHVAIFNVAAFLGVSQLLTTVVLVHIFVTFTSVSSHPDNKPGWQTDDNKPSWQTWLTNRCKGGSFTSLKEGWWGSESAKVSPRPSASVVGARTRNCFSQIAAVFSLQMISESIDVALNDTSVYDLNASFLSTQCCFGNHSQETSLETSNT